MGWGFYGSIVHAAEDADADYGDADYADFEHLIPRIRDENVESA